MFHIMLSRLPSMVVATGLLVMPWILSSKLIDPALLPRTILWAAMLAAVSACVILGRAGFRGAAHALWQQRFPWIMLLVYLGSVALSISQAGEPAEAMFEALRSGLWVLSIWLLALVFQRDSQAFGLICRVSVLLTLALTGVGLLQYYELAFLDLPGSRPPQATMVNRNLLTSALCLLAPFALYTSLRRSAVWRTTAVVALAAATALIMLANSRAAWLALAVAGTTTVVVLAWGYGGLKLGRQQKQLYRRRLGWTVAAVIATAVFFGSPLPRGDQASVVERMSAATALHQASVGERLGLWERTLPLIRKHPLLGVGPGNWKIEYAAGGLEGLRAEDGQTLFQRPHNDFLWIASESGLIALLAYLGLLGYAGYACVACLRRGTDKDQILTAAVMLFGIIAWAVIAVFSYPKERTVHLLLTSLMLASVWSAAAGAWSVEGGTRRGALFGAAAVALLLAIAAGIVAGERWRSERHTWRALEARRRGDWHSVIREMDRARSWAVKLDPTATPLAWYRGVGYFSTGRVDAALRDFETACAVNPYHLFSLNNRAACYERRGNHDEAQRYYLESLRLSPNSAEALLNLAAVYYNSGRYEDAARTIEQVPDTTTDPRRDTYRTRIERALRDSAGS